MTPAPTPTAECPSEPPVEPPQLLLQPVEQPPPAATAAPLLPEEEHLADGASARHGHAAPPEHGLQTPRPTEPPMEPQPTGNRRGGKYSHAAEHGAQANEVDRLRSVPASARGAGARTGRWDGASPPNVRDACPGGRPIVRVDDAAARQPVSGPEPGAQGTPAFEPPDIPVPVLPDDALRMIWGIVRVSQAACIIQHAVRAAIARAAGDPWDLPGLSPVHVTYDECCAPTHTRTHHHITVDVITSSPCRWGVWSHHQLDRLLWSETAWQAYN